MSQVGNGSTSIGDRLVEMGRLLSTLDRRVLHAFDTLERVGESTAVLDFLADDGAELVADLRVRLDRWDARLSSDLDEIKSVVLAKLGELDVGALNERVDVIETSLANIETAVTRMDAVLEGAVEAAPNFVTRRVQAAAEDVAEDLPGEAAG
ncbi:MAG TPA: hypothetical protein VNN79_14435 [Actinomycetota bacterium]|nr:hypothetical protein [Actinomycetota bacterium]